MKLYTSYWAQVRNFPKNLIGLNTTVWPPKWRPLGKDNNGVWVIDCPPVKPGAACEGLCNGKCANKTSPNCAFLQTYRKQLAALDINTFLSKLAHLKERIEKGENLTDVDFAFIVFEAPRNKCSERWALQDWLQIDEWKNI